MEYTNLGSSGLKCSKFALGNWVPQFNLEEVVSACYNAGINTFDTSEMYSQGDGQLSLGSALKNLKIPRSDVVIFEKIFFGERPNSKNLQNLKGSSKKRLTEGLDQSLKNLDMAYVDVVFIHRYDHHTPITLIL